MATNYGLVGQFPTPDKFFGENHEYPRLMQSIMSGHKIQNYRKLSESRRIDVIFKANRCLFNPKSF